MGYKNKSIFFLLLMWWSFFTYSLFNIILNDEVVLKVNSGNQIQAIAAISREILVTDYLPKLSDESLRQ